MSVYKALKCEACQISADVNVVKSWKHECKHIEKVLMKKNDKNTFSLLFLWAWVTSFRGFNSKNTDVIVKKLQLVICKWIEHYQMILPGSPRGVWPEISKLIFVQCYVGPSEVRCWVGSQCSLHSVL